MRAIPGSALSAWSVLAAGTVTHGEDLPCAGDSADLWFGTPDQQTIAARQCRRCPLLKDCGEYAYRAGERFGVWGGYTEQQRSRRRTA